MNAASMKRFKLRTASGAVVSGKVIVSGGNRVLTFVPDAPLALAATYVADFTGLTDLGGNPLERLHRALQVLTARPQLRTSLAGFPAVDLDFLSATSGATTSRYAVVASGTSTPTDPKILTIDVTNATTAMTVVANGYGGLFKKRILVSRGLDFALTFTTPSRPVPTSACNPATGSRFTGDLAVATNSNNDASSVQFFDVTDPLKPCLAGLKLLTANPETLNDYTRPGTIHTKATANGVAVLKTASGLTAYVAVGGVGLMAVDVGKSIPDQEPLDRVKEGLLGGDYRDVVTAGDRLLALEGTAGEVHVIEPNLALLSRFPVGGPARRLLYREGVPWDANRDGTVTPGEGINLLIVATATTIHAIDATRLDGMSLVTSVPMPPGEVPRGLDFDLVRRRLWVAAGGVYLVDLSGAGFTGLKDANGDGKDDRIAWSTVLPEAALSIRLDDRGYVFAGTEKGLQLISIDVPNIRGRAVYTHIPIDPLKGLDYDNADDRPIRNAVVQILDTGGRTIYAGVTSDDGYYAFTAPPGTQVWVQVMAAMMQGARRSVEVLNNYRLLVEQTHPNNPWQVAKLVTVPASGVIQVDLKAATTWNPAAPGGTGSYSARTGGAFAILDTIREAMTIIEAGDPAWRWVPLKVWWSPFNRKEREVAGALEPVDIPNGIVGTSHYSAATNGLYILGLQNEDTDEYDGAVMLHEWSHYWQSNYSRRDSPGGGHGGANEKLDPRVAFGEGFGTGFGAILARSPLYVDTIGPNQVAGLVSDLELGRDFDTMTNAWKAWTNFGTPSESANAALLWDLFDGTGAEGIPNNDAVTLGMKPIRDALTGTLTTGTPFVILESFGNRILEPYRRNPALATTLADLTALLGAWTVPVPPDDWGTNWYQVIPTDGTVVEKFSWAPNEALQTKGDTLDAQGDYNNKLGNRVFLRFDVPPGGEGDYTFTLRETGVVPVGTRADLYRGQWKDGCSVATRIMTCPLNGLQADSYVLEIKSKAAVTFTAALERR